MKTIELTYKFQAPVDEVWQAFINPEIIDKWGGGPAKMDDKEGFDFKLWGGDIYGTNTKVIKGKLLQQDWYGGNWDKPSKADFTFSTDSTSVKVKLVHKNIPDTAAKDIEQGWHDYYLGPMKELLES